MSLFATLKFNEGTGKHFIGGLYTSEALAIEDFENTQLQLESYGCEATSKLIDIQELEIIGKIK